MDIPVYKIEAHANLMGAVDASNIPDIITAVARGANINAAAADGRLPLHTAAAHGNLDVLNELLRLAADASVKTADGHTALWLAAAAGHEAIVKRLLRWDCSQPQELAAAADEAARAGRWRISARIMQKLFQKDEARCSKVLEQLEPHMAKQLDQASMQCWLEDVNNEQQRQQDVQEHQQRVDAQQQGLEQLLFRVAGMACEQQPKRPLRP